MQSFLVYPKRSLVDEYLNVHLKKSNSLGFNNNIKVADIQKIFYCTLYSFKDQLPEKNFEFLNVCTILTRRFECMEKEMEDHNIDEGFKEDLQQRIGTLFSKIRCNNCGPQRYIVYENWNSENNKPRKQFQITPKTQIVRMKTTPEPKGIKMKWMGVLKIEQQQDTIYRECEKNNIIVVNYDYKTLNWVYILLSRVR